MTRAEKKEELIGLFAVGAIFIGDLIDECFEFADEHPIVSNLENTGKDLTPDKDTIKQVVSLYKQWYSEQCDQPLYDYVQERWEDNDDTAKDASTAFNAMMGDPEQDLDSIIKDLKTIIKKLKS